MERNQSQQEKQALAKLERIKLDQGKRAEDLERDAAEAESKVGAHLQRHDCAHHVTVLQAMSKLVTPAVHSGPSSSLLLSNSTSMTVCSAATVYQLLRCRPGGWTQLGPLSNCSCQ